MNNKNDAKKISFFLPNIFTALNMACGFASICFAQQGYFYQAAMILILGAIFDSVDGRVARMTGTQSEFGEQFDSLSDLITFGLAPALLMYARFFPDLGRLGLVVAFLYLLCGALRLARFNANADKISSDFFQGLPIPGAALAQVGLVLISLEYPDIGAYSLVPVFHIVVYSFLMISVIPFNSFKNSQWVKRKKKTVLLLIFLIFALIFTYEELMVSVLINFYVVGCIIYFFTHKGQLQDVFTFKSEKNEEEDDDDDVDNPRTLEV
jgi:CDP-diacylglycerol---serine O-phosphatidyltransferase